MKHYKPRWLSLTMAFLLSFALAVPAGTITGQAKTVPESLLPVSEKVQAPSSGFSLCSSPVPATGPVLLAETEDSAVPATAEDSAIPEEPGNPALLAAGDSALAEKEAADRALAQQMEEAFSDSYIDVDTHVPKSIRDYKNYYPADDASFETSYDPRTIAGLKDRIPAVRNQNPLGTCWAHSAIFMSEMYLAAKGQNMSSENMSEFQLAYFGSHDWEDPLGNATNDNFYRVETDTTNLAAKWYNSGNTTFTKFMMMDWLGAVSENTYPETAYSRLTSSIDQGSGISSAYLSDDYAILKDSIHVQDVSVLNSEDMDVLKTAIKEHGSVGISYYSQSSYYKTVDSSNTSYYYPNATGTNHAVAIVGWDDDYSTANFKTSPPADGAWLVRNSWGSSWGGNGYFWISYYDKSLASVAYCVKAYRKGDASNYYDHNYQYDGGINPGSALRAYSGGLTGANVFTASGKEVLKAVSFYTLENYEYTVDVYTGLTDLTNPASGTLKTSKSGTQLYEGYHTVALNSNVPLNPGDVFSIVVTLKSQNGSTAFFYDRDYDGSWIISLTEAKAGQSFLRPASSSGSWTDMGSQYRGNLRIKAYTNNNVARPVTSIRLRRDSADTITLAKNSTYDLNGSTSGTKNMTVNPSSHDDQIFYSSSNERVASINARGVITTLQPGETQITVSARCGSATDTVTLKVPLDKPAAAITLGRGEASVQAGKTLKLNATVTPSDSDDYDAYWTSSAPETARVDNDGTITGVSEGTAVITVKTLSGQSASCTVTVVKHSSENLSFAFNKIASKLYKGGTYTITPSTSMSKLKPVSIEWSCTSPNTAVSPLGENGISGCVLMINQVNSSKNKGERFTVQAKVTYAKLSKKGATVKEKIFKKKTTAYNLSYNVSLDKEEILSFQKENVTLTATLNDGDTSDQPTNKKLKWMITNAEGKPDKNGKKVISINSKGIVKTKGPGRTYITVCAADSYDKKTKTYKVTKTIPVVCPAVTSVRFSESTGTLAPNSSVELKSKLIFNNGQSEPFNKEGMKLTWSSSNRKYISVNSKGMAKASKKAVPGTYTITVKAVGGVMKGQTVPEGAYTIIIPENGV